MEESIVEEERMRKKRLRKRKQWKEDQEDANRKEDLLLWKEADRMEKERKKQIEKSKLLKESWELMVACLCDLEGLEETESDHVDDIIEVDNDDQTGNQREKERNWRKKPAV